MIVPRFVWMLYRTTSWAPRSCMQPSSLGAEARDELMIYFIVVDINNPQISTFGLRIECKRVETQYVSQVLEDFVDALMIWDLHIVVVQPGSFKRIFNTTLQFPATSLTRDVFIPHSRTSCWVFDPCFAPVSGCFLTQTLNPAADSPGHQKHPNLRTRVASGSVGFWNQASRARFRYRRLFSCLPFSNSLRHGVCLFNWTKMSAREHREIHDVKLTENVIPLITRKTSFGRVNKSASRFLVSTNLIWILGSKLTLSNNLSNATLWVIGLRPLMIIWITAALSSKMYNCASHGEEVAFVVTVQHSIYLFSTWR